jgi:ABC-type transport system involved in cytochrome c biogenesis permease subunit
MKKLPLLLLLLLIAAMATATWVEKQYGTDFAYTHFYGSIWFTGLWAALAMGALLSIVKGKMYRNIPLFLLHTSFVVILAGAFFTKLWAEQGTVTLRQGEVCNEMPFTIRLDSFRVAYYAGTDAPADYVSHVWVDGKYNETISMNHILSYKGYRFYQSSFEADGRTSILSVNRDVAGIPVTYAGYALFVLSMVWIAINQWKKKFLKGKTLVIPCLLAFFFLPHLLSARVVTDDSLTVNEQQAAGIGKLWMLYDGRITPVATFAHDFTLKLTGKTTVGRFNAEQVLAGFLFVPEKWQRMALFKVKNAELREELNATQTQAAYIDFFDEEGNYKLARYGYGLSAGEKSPKQKEIEKLNEKIQLIHMLHSGEPLRLFPLPQEGKVQWFHPMQHFPAGITDEDAVFIRSALTNYYQALQRRDEGQCTEILHRISDFQQQKAADLLPSETKRKAEIFYLKHDFASLLFKINLVAGILCLMLMAVLKNKKGQAFSRKIFVVQLIHSFAFLTVFIALRTYIGGRLPFANGFETMLLLAWCAMAAATLFRRKMPLMLPFGLLISGCALLVAHLGMMNPRITPLVPVLSSPLLSLHVSSIMIAYTLLAFTSLNSLFSILFQRRTLEQSREQNLQCLFPAVFFMGAGIFIGAVWANVSWGRYWGWDPKETWALITFLVYALLLHKSFSPKNPLLFHIICLLDFSTVLMTYFGVSYFLGGMHAY